MQRIRIIVAALLLAIPCAGFSRDPMQLVEQFATLLSRWSETGDKLLQPDVKRLCVKGRKEATFTDDLTQSLVAQYAKDRQGEKSEDGYDLARFLTVIDRQIDAGAKLHLSEFSVIPAEQVEEARSKRINPKEWTFVACKATLSGPGAGEYPLLIYVHPDYIAKVDNYVVDTNGKVRVDLKDLVEDESWGFTYNYGEHLPIGLSGFYTYSFLMIGLDAGYILKRDRIAAKGELEMTDVLNFKKKTGEYKPSWYVTATPSIYLRYVALGCGAGVMVFTGTEQGYEVSTGASGYSNVSTTTDRGFPRVKFMLRPVLRGFIPINDECDIVLSAGYDYVFGYKEKNGFNCGIGLKFSY